MIKSEKEIHPNLLNAYDEAVSRTFINLFHFVKDGDIILDTIDRKNKEHLYLLYVALTVAHQYGKELYICSSWWNRFCLRKHTKKYFKHILKKKKLPNVYADNLLEYERAASINRIGNDFRFGDIYDAYYSTEMRSK